MSAKVTTDDFHQRDEFWADARLIADAVKEHAEIRAYLFTGGSDGCAQCTRGSRNNGKPPMTFKERVERGHLRCAESLAVTKGAQGTAANMGEVWIEISRIMEDPRFGQWLLAQTGRRD
jgi:hypothetical protein